MTLQLVSSEGPIFVGKREPDGKIRQLSRGYPSDEEARPLKTWYATFGGEPDARLYRKSVVVEEVE